MAVGNRSIAVTGDATAVVVYTNPAGGPVETVFVDNAGGNTVYIGATSATTDGTNGVGASASNKGFPVATATQRTFTLLTGEALYVFAHVTNTITVWANGQ